MVVQTCGSTKFVFYQPGVHSKPGWSYNYFTILCLSLCASVTAYCARAITHYYGHCNVGGVNALVQQSSSRVAPLPYVIHKQAIAKGMQGFRENNRHQGYWAWVKDEREMTKLFALDIGQEHSQWLAPIEHGVTHLLYTCLEIGLW